MRHYSRIIEINHLVGQMESTHAMENKHLISWSVMIGIIHVLDWTLAIVCDKIIDRSDIFIQYLRIIAHAHVTIL